MPEELQRRSTKDGVYKRESAPDNKNCTAGISVKPYRCLGCGKEERHDTNHWGYIYPRCTCGHTEWECLEPVPEGMSIPPRWKHIRLGDIVDIKEGS